MNKLTRDNFSAFLDRIKSALPSMGLGKRDVTELATFLGVRKNQVQEWVIDRRYMPNGAIALRMVEWVNGKSFQAALTEESAASKL